MDLRFEVELLMEGDNLCGEVGGSTNTVLTYPCRSNQSRAFVGEL